MGDAEVPEHQRRDVDDPGGRGLEPDGEHGHLRIAELEGAVTAPADVVTPARVREFDARLSGDDQVARVRVRERGPGALERLGLIEDAAGAFREPAVHAGRETKELAGTTRHGCSVVPVQHHVVPTVEALGEVRGLGAAAREAVDHAGTVGCGHRKLRTAAVRSPEEPEVRERVLEAFDPLDRCLTVIRAEDHGITSEKLIGAARGLEQGADRAVRSRECRVGAFRPRCV